MTRSKPASSPRPVPNAPRTNPLDVAAARERPLPAAPGHPERFDYEYVRNGIANLFVISEPLLSWRAEQMTERGTTKAFAEVLRWIVEDLHAEADKVVLVMDNLNTHRLASLYKAFPPDRRTKLDGLRRSWRSIAHPSTGAG